MLVRWSNDDIREIKMLGSKEGRPRFNSSGRVTSGHSSLSLGRKEHSSIGPNFPNAVDLVTKTLSQQKSTVDTAMGTVT